MPWHNEGTQKLSLHPRSDSPGAKFENIATQVTRSNIFHSLTLLHESKQLELFDALYITNDCSSDDTVTKIQQFRDAHPQYSITILENKEHKGKGKGFIDMMKRAHQDGMDMVVTTDADMIHPWNIYASIIEEIETNYKTIYHLIAPMHEANRLDPRPHILGGLEYNSWVRAVTTKEFMELYTHMRDTIHFTMSCDKYSLEMALNYLYSKHTKSLKLKPWQHMPIFLEPYRFDFSSLRRQDYGHELVNEHITWDSKFDYRKFDRDFFDEMRKWLPNDYVTQHEFVYNRFRDIYV